MNDYAKAWNELEAKINAAARLAEAAVEAFTAVYFDDEDDLAEAEDVLGAEE